MKQFLFVLLFCVSACLGAVYYNLQGANDGTLLLQDDLKTSIVWGDSTYVSKVTDSVYVDSLQGDLNNDSAAGAWNFYWHIFINHTLKCDTLYVYDVDTIGGTANLHVTKKIKFYFGNRCGLTNTMYLEGAGGDTCAATLNNIVYNSAGSWRMVAPYLYGNYSVVTGSGKPQWIGLTTILGNYDTTGMTAANWSNRPETSSVVSASRTIAPTAGLVIDTMRVKGAGARKGLYARVVYGTTQAGIESWARHGSSDTVIIIDTIPAHATGKAKREVFDQYGGSAVGDSITYLPPTTGNFFIHNPIPLLFK